MKKSLSMLLAVVMMISIFTSSIVTANAAVASDFFTVSKTDYVNDEITYTINLKKGVTKLEGAIIRVVYDSTVLEVKSGGAAGTYDSANNLTPNIAGTYVQGTAHDDENVYTMAYASATGYTVGADTAFFTVKFAAISEDRPKTSVSFTCVEVVTDDEQDNEITKADPQALFEDSFHTLSRPVIEAVDSVDDVLNVQWLPCAGADYYNVYRKSETETSWSKVNTDYVYETSYSDESIEKDVEYTYLVTAVNEAGETALVGAGKPGMNFGTITSIEVSTLSNGILIEWGALNVATSYDVLRKLPTETQWTKIKTVTDAKYEDTTAASGVEYNYSIRAHKGNYTAGMSASVPTIRYIGMPTITVSNVEAGLLVTISAVGGAEEYVIGKAVNGGASQGNWKTVSASEFTDDGYTFTDTEVEGDKGYIYTAYAKAGEDVGHTQTCPVITRLATPALSSIENTAAGIKVTWKPVNGATKYNVYRKAEGATDFTLYNTTTETYLENKVVENGKMYIFTVAAQNDTGCSSFDTTGLEIKRVNASSNISAVTTSQGIKVTWSAVDGADSYVLYSKTGTGSYKELKKDITDTSYVDTSAQKNVQYTYVVKAKNGSYYSAISAVEAQGMNFGTVTSLTGKKISNGVTLTWSALSNATGYKVYRKTASDVSFKHIKTVTGSNSYNDTTIPSGVVCEYKVEAYNGANVAEMSAPVLSFKYLAVPGVSARNSADKVKVTITPVYGAEKYVIERAVGTSTTYSYLTTVNADTLEYLDDNNIVEGEKYSYKVKAVAGTTESFYGTASMTKLIAPKLTSCYNEIPGVQLRWTAIEDAQSYIVYRKLPGAKDWTSLAVTQKTEYVDASVIPNTVYQYTVEAKTPDGNTGYDSVGRECRFIETPDLVSRANSVGGVTIKWNKVAGATSYRIYRRGAGTNYWYYLGDVSATQDTFFDKEGKAASQIKSGNYYRYTVRASYVGKDSTGKDYTIYSGFDTTGLYLKYMASPKLTGISNAANGLYIKWNAVAGVTNGYRVYRRGAGSTYWTYLGTVKTTSYTDSGVKNANGGYYRYTVIADGGYHSAFDTTGLYLKRLANPTLVSASSAKAGITVKWNKINGAGGYYVYRKTSGTTWTRVGTVSGVNNVKFVDKSAKKGVTYTYTVRAYSGGTLSSYNSKGISCKDRY